MDRDTKTKIFFAVLIVTLILVLLTMITTVINYTNLKDIAIGKAK